ncbi:dihydrodipicolinate synthase family protein [Glutamicibacter creatinolyticus]|uniref:dihydrodipicolinate synthase family protein n=1 Tax=Glutamicibacter creatinolyticus TaxID=162496 RepID=UPI0033D3064B
MKFAGLSAFPLVPMTGERVDIDAVARLVARAAGAGVDCLGVLGSTGNYAYLDPGERREVLAASISAAQGTPVLAGVGALRTRDVLRHVADAQAAGAQGLLLAPVSYQKVTDQEVFDLYRTVSQASDLPVIVYDNPGTTGFSFSDELHGRIAGLEGISGVKIPPPAADGAHRRIAELRRVVPDGYGVGISGDWMAAEGLGAGCDTWYSVIAGVLPGTALRITRAAQAGGHAGARDLSRRLEPLWDLFRSLGSLRVVSALAEELGLVSAPSLPLPLQGIPGAARQRLREFLAAARLEDDV